MDKNKSWRSLYPLLQAYP